VTPEFLLTTLIVVATPGAGVLYTVAAGISRGWRASLVAAFACTLGIVPHMVAAVTGLAAIMHASAVAFSVIKLLGVAYLLYLAWKTFRDKSVFEVQTGPAKVSPWRVIGSGVLVNTLNPKLTIFFFAFLPQFVAPDRDGAVLLTDREFGHAVEPPTAVLREALEADFTAVEFVVSAKPVLNEKRRAGDERRLRALQHGQVFRNA